MSSRVPNLELVWSSTTLGLLKECPRKYQYSIIEGWASRGENIDINFGWLYHGALERFQRRLAEGLDRDSALVSCVTWTMIEAKPLLLADPSETAANKSLRNLIRSIVWHCDNFEHDVLEQVILANGEPAVELSFVIDAGIQSASGEDFQFSGHLDRLVRFNNATYWHDYKTTKTTLGDNYFEGFNPDNQATLYTLASRVAFDIPTLGGMIDAAQIAVGFTRFGRKPINRTQGQLDEWLNDTRMYLAQAEVYAVRNHWPMNDKACFRCNFRDICSKDPRVRQSFLRSNFGTRNYDPLEVRK
jgi:hypothetical protein